MGLPKEVDFINEARNSKRCKEMLKESKDIVIPTIYDEFSSSWVITMTFEKGIHVGKVTELQE